MEPHPARRPELGGLLTHPEGSWLPKAEAGVGRVLEAQAQKNLENQLSNLWHMLCITSPIPTKVLGDFCSHSSRDGELTTHLGHLVHWTPF